MPFQLTPRGDEYVVTRRDALTQPAGFLYWNNLFSQWEFSFSFQKPNWTGEELKEILELITSLEKPNAS